MASYSALPEPMLARSGRLPKRGDYAYEVKWDGFGAIVSTEGPLRVRSRRGWDMTPHVTFLSEFPVRAALGVDGIEISERDILDGAVLAAPELPEREVGDAPPGAYTCC